MNTARILVGFAFCSVCVLGSLLACDEKPKAGSSGATSASVSASAAATAAVPSDVWSATTAASATPFASASSSLITGDAKDVILTVKDPTKETEKTIKAQPGGSVTLFLPDFPGTVWSIDSSDKTLGKAKEEVIPGFAPGTNGHQFKWPTNGPLIKPGGKHKVQLVNKKAGDKAAKPQGNFTLNIEIT
jgi:hypothetical protein